MMLNNNQFMSDFKIFIVEDDPWYGKFLQHHLSLNPDYEVHLFENGKDCIDNLNQNPNVVCMDYGLPDITGDKLLNKVHKLKPEIPVIVISAQEEIAVAVDLLKAGANDYIIKDTYTKDILWKAILRIKEKDGLKQEVIELKEMLIDKYDFEKTIIGQSKAIKRTFKLIHKAIVSNINISITGETGTGKEVVAKAIHYNCARRKMPFIAINMSAIPKDLIESELFGHEKGAFTGAIAAKKGKFEEAQGGTIFLDEISELDIGLQSKLLRVIQEREVVRLGSNKVIKFDARIITATHRDLTKEVKEGNFREDLYFRIVGLPIELPPLRMRDNDILILSKHFIELYAKENRVKAPALSTAAKNTLMKYYFPGNVRELKAIIDLACVMSSDGQIEEEDITFHNIKQDEFIATAKKTLKEFNIDIIKLFLNKYDNNVVEVAKKLDIGKSTIYNMISKGEINLKDN